MVYQAVSILGLLCFSGLGLASQDFSYDGQHGPSHWGENYNTCVGKHQSPINIEEHRVKNTNLPSLKFNGLDEPRGTYLMNNGHTVMLRMNNSESAQISGGPLGEDSYVFEQLHFHWGTNDLEGSEDMINNHSFAMELHAVFYKKSYGSMAAAVAYSDGLTVLAYFFEASEEDNPTYKSIVDALPKIEGLDSTLKLPEDLIIESIIVPKNSDMNRYFTYNGSLTTPPCSEVVTWIDFVHSLQLSHKQIAAFRDVRTAEGEKLTHNFRPVQPLEDRIVYNNFPNGSIEFDSKADTTDLPGGQTGLSGSLILTFIAFLLTFRSTLAILHEVDIR